VYVAGETQGEGYLPGSGEMHSGVLQYQVLPSQMQVSWPYRHSYTAFAAQRWPVLGLAAGQTAQDQDCPTFQSLHAQVTLP
jgi:hypothetical protein